MTLEQPKTPKIATCREQLKSIQCSVITNLTCRTCRGTTMNGTGTFDLKSAAKITAELAPALTLQTLQPPSLTLMEVKKSLKGQSNLNVNK